MDRINFQNNVTKLDKEMFDTFQNNIEKSAVVVSTTQPTTSEKVWFKKGKNKFNSDKLSSQTNTGITTSFDSSTMKLNGTSTGDGSIYYYAVKIGNKWYLDHEKGFSVGVESGDWNY